MADVRTNRRERAVRAEPTKRFARPAGRSYPVKEEGYSKVGGELT